MNIFTKRTFAAALIMMTAPIALPAGANAQGMSHTFFMRGSVVGMESGVPTICIGKADGARAGQILDVVRVTTLPGTRGGQAFRRDNVGSVRIESIIDDHFAVVKVVKGEVAKHDIVELRRK